MPELPEVETVARTLAPDIAGKKICALSCLNTSSWADEISYDCLAAFQPRIQRTGRKGKLLLLYFEPFMYAGYEISALAFHLKMSGRLFYYFFPKELEKHTRIMTARYRQDYLHIPADSFRQRIIRSRIAGMPLKGSACETEL